MTGIVTGFEIGKNRNGTKNVVLLQVRLRDKNDIQTVELMTPPGDDSIPPLNSRVAILKISESYKIAIAQHDNIDPSMDEGEKKIYSQSGDTIQAFINLLNNGIIEINGNSDFAVAFNDLKAGYDQLRSDHNSHIHTETGTVTTVPTVLSTASIDNSKVDEVKLP